ncbi:MBL fold metallo-hydrolase [uncultured Clostridium sp.]|uniref:MBL fold metallo-hydrolase n=1 Tax=uncultured Clostridium sp. TaxID=59620 RepID=UPI002624F51D|nr:MBL fold metallo-hydrolase [uncultured Clostridium sp.]
MLVKTIVTGMYEENCYLLINEKTNSCAIVDPGDEFSKIEKEIEELKVTPKFILLTHAHFDHVGAVKELQDKYKIPFYMNENEDAYVKNDNTVFGNLEKADKFLCDGDVINLDDIEIKVIHTPGHTKGGVCYLGDRKLISGDTLFQGSVGRADFPGGDMNELIKSINLKLLNIGDDVEVYPGHGPKTTIGFEKKMNPFLN